MKLTSFKISSPADGACFIDFTLSENTESNDNNSSSVPLYALTGDSRTDVLSGATSASFSNTRQDCMACRPIFDREEKGWHDVYLGEGPGTWLCRAQHVGDGNIRWWMLPPANLDPTDGNNAEHYTHLIEIRRYNSSFSNAAHGRASNNDIGLQIIQHGFDLKNNPRLKGLEDSEKLTLQKFLAELYQDLMLTMNGIHNLPSRLPLLRPKPTEAV